MEDAAQHPRTLVNRRVETERLAAFLADISQGGAALVVTGDRGIGKTAVLQEASSTAAGLGMRVVRVEIPDARGGPQAGLGLLAAQLGSGSPAVLDPVDRLAAGNELLHELGRASAATPLLLTIDNADRLDVASIDVLTFVGRRLAATRAGLLAASTSDESSRLRRRGLPELRLPALTDSDAAGLLSTRAPELALEVAERVLAEARGNPLSLVELPAALTERQRRGLDPLPGVLPLTERLRAVYRPAIMDLSPEAFDLLVAVAVTRPLDFDAIAARSSTDSGTGILGLGRLGMQALRELEECELVEVQQDAQRIRFPTTMTRNAVIDGASDAQLRRAHLRLSAALKDRPDRRVWHDAAAVDHADADMAQALEQLAYAASRLGDVDEAVVCMLRAAELSPRSLERGARMAAAAHLQLSVAGDLRSATRLLDEASKVHAGSAGTITAATAAAQLLLMQGAHLSDSRQVLVTALEARSPAGDAGSGTSRQTAAALQLLFYICLLEARSEPWHTYDRMVRLQGQRRGPILTMVDGLLPDITRAAGSSLTALDVAIAGISEASADPSEVILVGIAAFHLDRLAECRAALSRVVDEARTGPTRFLGTQAMLRLSLDDCLTGQFARSTRLAKEALAMSAALGHDDHTWPFELSLALVAAMRGDRSDVDSLTRTMVDWAIPRGALLVEHHCAHVRCLAALGEADFETAYHLATSISPAGTLAGYNNVAVWACLDVVEAAVHTGRQEAAQAHADALVRSGIAGLSSRLALRVATAVAMTAPDVKAPGLFDEALAIGHVDRWPFETARVELAYGERLRLLRDPARAQEHLWPAFETFRRLGARTWSARAAEQLRAVGAPVSQHQPRSRSALTGRDREIATLAASGLSNREIGEKLFLSPRTVGSRLYRIFPKLGVTSRAALRDALDRQDLAPAEEEDLDR